MDPPKLIVFLAPDMTGWAIPLNHQRTSDACRQCFQSVAFHLAAPNTSMETQGCGHGLSAKDLFSLTSTNTVLNDSSQNSG